MTRLGENGIDCYQRGVRAFAFGFEWHDAPQQLAFDFGPEPYPATEAEFTLEAWSRLPTVGGAGIVRISNSEGPSLAWHRGTWIDDEIDVTL